MTLEARRPDPVTPTSEIEAIDPANIHIDPDMDVLPQIFEHTEEIRRENISGLSYSFDGLNYQVSSLHTQYTREPRNEWATFRYTFNLRQPEGRHEVVLDDRVTEYVTLKSYDSKGNLHSREQMPTAQFAELLNDIAAEATSRGEEPLLFHLGEILSEEPTADIKRFPVDFSDKRRSIYSHALDTAENNGLRQGAVGLTWFRDGYQNQIIEDECVVEYTKHGPRISRLFCIEVINPNEHDPEKRIINRYTKDSNGLRMYFQAMNTPPNPPLRDLHIEVPDMPYYIIAPGEERRTGEELTRADAIKLLSYTDIYEEDDERRQDKIEKISRKEAEPYVKALQDMVKEVGLSKMLDIADHMLAQYLVTVEKFELEGDGVNENHSLSWVLLELARRRYLSENRDLIDRDALDKGTFIDDPVSTEPSALKVRRDIVDARVGQTYIPKGLHIARGQYPTKKPKAIPPELMLQDGAEYELADVYEPFAEINYAVTELLSPNIKEDIERILHKATFGSSYSGREKKAEPISNGEFAFVGALLGRTSNQRLLR